jgi:leucyl aminopeptidase
MQITTTTHTIESLSGSVLAIGIFKDESESPTAQCLNDATGNLLSQLLDDDLVDLNECKTTVLVRPAGLKFQRVLIVGLGKKKDWDQGAAYRTAATALKSAGAKLSDSVVMAGWSDALDTLHSAVAGATNGCVGQDLFKQERALHEPSQLIWCCPATQSLESRSETSPTKVDPTHSTDTNSADSRVAESADYEFQAAEAIQLGSKIGDAINLTRRLINLPANYIYPESFVDEVSQVASPLGLTVEIWDEERLKSENCGALLAVARGSAKSPRLLILKHKGSTTGDFDVALVGKGVTFDSGGLSLKPSDSMITMKCDMGGGATVAGIMCGLAAIDSPRPVIGLIGLVENMISADAYRLGDVLTARNGKTIEVHNTDAEGRLVLADTLDVACDFEPEHIVDFATLTGACVVALGTNIVGAMTNDEAWQAEILDASKESGEYVWPLPMHKFFSEEIKGKIADIKNVGEGRWGGATTAGKFLEEFVRDKSWLHLDIAGPAFFDSPKSWCDAGASGVMVRTMIEFLRKKATE